MDSDPSQISVEPIPFEHGLTRFAQSIRGRAKIVAIGSSSTVGHGNIKPYPERLLSLLRAQYPNAGITMVNQGIGGQEAPIQVQRFDTDVIAEKPDVVGDEARNRPRRRRGMVIGSRAFAAITGKLSALLCHVPADDAMAIVGRGADTEYAAAA